MTKKLDAHLTLDAKPESLPNHQLLLGRHQDRDV